MWQAKVLHWCRRWTAEEYPQMRAIASEGFGTPPVNASPIALPPLLLRCASGRGVNPKQNSLWEAKYRDAIRLALTDALLHAAD
jgi:hypothetical protein